MLYSIVISNNVLEAGGEVFPRDWASSASHLDVWVQFIVQYTVQYGVQYSVQYSVQYIIYMWVSRHSFGCN